MNTPSPRWYLNSAEAEPAFDQIEDFIKDIMKKE